MSAALGESVALRDAVGALRDTLDATALPLDLLETREGQAQRAALLRQFDDYILPRLDSIDAPLLAVVGGSTGAGKSTLVNSIVGGEVSRSGVLRPTTTTPTLIHHPDDSRWFTSTRVLPRLSRVTGTARDDEQPDTVRLVSTEALAPGLALLDAPDIDSVVSANRSLAGQLLQAADMWVFVTTAARYADAVPWDLLRNAAERGTAVAIVLDRVPPEDLDEVRPHLIEMLREQDLGTSPVFTVPESQLTDDGLLPPEALGRLGEWLRALAEDRRARDIIVNHTLSGALSSLGPRLETVVDAAGIQHQATRALSLEVDKAYDTARDHVAEGMTDGSLLRGEVLARWQEFIGTGEFFRNMESAIARWRDKLTAAIRGNPTRTENVDEALQSGVADLIRAQADGAAAQIARTWRAMPGGDTVLRRAPSLSASDGTVPHRIERLVRDWQGEILTLVSSEGKSRRLNARIAAYGINGIALFLMLVTFAHTAGLSGAEVGIAGGASVLAQRVLEAIFGDQAVREMARKARELLLERVDALYDDERARYHAGLGPIMVGSGAARRLEAAAAEVESIRRRHETDSMPV
ncbi:MAG: dynamin family protein [Actinomycetia bacterium]|nr:dynamin family protein [Actinomycetes bacterium]